MIKSLKQAAPIKVHVAFLQLKSATICREVAIILITDCVSFI